MNELGIPLYPQGQSYVRRNINGLISQQEDSYQSSEALWWYQLQMKDGQWQINDRVTSFNARSLDRPLWREAIALRRGVVLATEIGESQAKDRYLMQAPEGLILGTVYKDWADSQGNITRSMAVVTRPAQQSFAQFHEKSMPLFLPNDPAVIKHWLDPNVANSELIQSLLDQPKIYSDLQIQKVKTFKHAEALGEVKFITKDDD